MSRWLALRQIALVATERDPVVDDLAAILDTAVCFEDPGVATFGLHNALLPVGTQMVEVVAPVTEGTTAGRYLERRKGDGGYMVITQCNDHAERRARVEELGIRIVAQLGHGNFTNMQLHPADTGGSFLEIDRMQGDDPEGPWEPAGRQWPPTTSSGLTTAIVAVDMQCDDPAAVAERWSSIVELPSSSDGDGRWSIQLANATLRFVPLADDRGEGLSGVDVATSDPDRMRQIADDRGHLVADDAAVIGGVRFAFIS